MTQMSEDRAFWSDVLDGATRALVARRPPRRLLGKRPAVISIDLYELAYAGGPRPVVELLVYKKRAGAFFGTPLVAYLNERGIDSLLMIGESTSGCLRASAVEAASYGYPLIIVGDCVFDRHEAIHQVNLLDMHLKYATV